MAKTNRWIWLLAMLLLLVGTLAGGAWYADKKNSLTDAVVVYPEREPLTQVDLIDGEGEPFTEQNFSDHWSLVFVGYTYCPDICPTTLSDLSRVYPELAKLSDKVQVIFVSADPARDTPERLKVYTEYFNPNFIAVTAEHEQLMPVVQQLGLIYGIFDKEEENYLVDHSASIALVNPKGELHAAFRPDFDEKTEMPLVNGPELVKNFSSILARWRG
ncbi:SCO family protein [Oceanisphaera avium]|uniref:SCO family protein n=1 Tax=Oceanisphaera avium TaxID=1903694 RepID=A0A1Y0CZT7_9GAMM|nr:SCO family protein [Oceanisphaera avium]ART80315.1 SCO family protein [Oceanisphaera avium]